MCALGGGKGWKGAGSFCRRVGGGLGWMGDGAVEYGLARALGWEVGDGWCTGAMWTWGGLLQGGIDSHAVVG
jgi:hypothetical protein